MGGSVIVASYKEIRTGSAAEREAVSGDQRPWLELEAPGTECPVLMVTPKPSGPTPQQGRGNREEERGEGKEQGEGRVGEGCHLLICQY
jgi:hypothetical protein